MSSNKEMATLPKEKMTALANGVRELSGTTTKKGLDAMINDLSTANTEVSGQTNLIAQILAKVNSLPEAGSGGSGGGTGDIQFLTIVNNTDYSFYVNGFGCNPQTSIDILRDLSHYGLSIEGVIVATGDIYEDENADAILCSYDESLEDDNGEIIEETTTQSLNLTASDMMGIRYAIIPAWMSGNTVTIWKRDLEV